MKWNQMKYIWKWFLCLLLASQIILRLINTEWSMKYSAVVTILLFPLWITLVFRTWRLIYHLHAFSYRNNSNYTKPFFMSSSLFPQNIIVTLLTMVPPVIVVNIFFGLEHYESQHTQLLSGLLLITSIAAWFFIVVEPMLKNEFKC